MSAAIEEAVPVFVSPRELLFRINERNPQLFTLYNPYPYAISYKVLCTAPSHYTVTDATGSLQSECCKDIVVRCIHKIQPGNIDKLKVEIMMRGETKVIGSRQIELKSVNNDSGDIGSANKDSSAVKNMAASITSERISEINPTLTWVHIVIVFGCALALVCPTTGDPSSNNSNIPQVLHMTVPQKVVASYILGIVTMLILRPL